MKLKVLRKGMKGKEVGDWQTFLRGLNIYYGKIDDDFGRKTDAATRKFQKRYRLTIDGVVGSQCYGKAMMLGFKADAVEDKEADFKLTAAYPKKPDFKPLSGNKAREKLFGKFEYKHTPTDRNPEKITITDDWAKKNIVKVKLPTLSKATNGKYTVMRFHKLAKDQLEELFQRIDKEGLTDRILTYAGAFYPRYVRGSRTNLSNHSWGTAFDINVAWNGLRRTPALVGKKGCVREIAEIGFEYGFYWGGHFSRLDGMHFEVAKIL
jgi:hypothetical protein